MAATNAAGTTTVRYGKMRANVLALEAVLADGRVIRTGPRARKTSAGYDLTGLLVGSEGTLAVITELTLRLQPIPEHAVALRICSPTSRRCVAPRRDRRRRRRCHAARTARRMGRVGGQRVLGNVLSGDPLPVRRGDGNARGRRGGSRAREEIARSEGATEIAVERDPDARARLWKARHDMAHAAAAKIPGTKERATDVCVPLTELAGAVRFARTEIDRLGLHGGSRARGRRKPAREHPCRPETMRRDRRADELVHHIVDDALARGGTCSGEHGIGQGKIGALQQEHGDLITLMPGIKQVFDPLGIMNPGKVLPAVVPD